MAESWRPAGPKNSELGRAAAQQGLEQLTAIPNDGQPGIFQKPGWSYAVIRIRMQQLQILR